VSKLEKRSWRTDQGRAKHLIRHLGDRPAHLLTQKDVDLYRELRLEEKTKRGGPPAPATLNREFELLSRMLNYAVDCRELDANPLTRVKKLKEDNVRTIVIEEDQFQLLLEAAEPALKPILLVAYDTGIRLGNVLALQWSKIRQTDKRWRIDLPPQDVKANSPPTVVLTTRVQDALSQLPRSISGYLFVNPETGTRWKDIRKMFYRVKGKVDLSEIWFHDLRRSFITNARQSGVDESTIMSMSGHKTRSAFDRYNIVCERDQERAVDQIEAVRARDAQNRVFEETAGA
jgi:integrase